MTNILELARRARKSGLRVVMRDPSPELPDTQAHLGIPLDPQLESLFGVTNGCEIGSLFVYGAVGVRYELVRTNLTGRILLDYIPLLHDVLVCAAWGHSAIELVTLPAHADERGCQPVVLLDTNDEPYVSALASTLDRAFELAVIHDIGRTTDDDGWHDDPFPDTVAHYVAEDIRLVELLRAGVFDNLGGGVDVDRDWHARLLELAPA